MRLKKFMALSMATVMVASLVGCGGSNGGSSDGGNGGDAGASEDKKVTLVMAEVNPLDTIVGQTDSYFKEQVEKLTNGTVTIDLQASGVLGSENDVLDTMLGGGDTIDISRISAFALTSYGAKKSTLLSLPYMFESREHYWNFVKSDMSDDFLNESLEKTGLRGLFYGEEGFRHFFTKKEIKTMDDLKGLKLRVSNDPVMTGLVNGLGASPTVVSFNELYSSIQSGVVDGAEQPIANYKSNAFQEVAPNLILDGHTLGAIEVVIREEVWGKLSKNQQDAIMKAAELTEDYNKNLSQTQEDKVLEELKTMGVNVVEVNDKTEWANACSDVTTQYTKGYEDLFKKIKELK